jgi:hypothetical protein
VTIPPGLYGKRDMIRAVNKALKEASKPFRFNRSGAIVKLETVDGVTQVSDKVEVDLAGAAAQLPPPLQFWCGMCAIISFCEKEQDTPAWMVAKRMYDKFVKECNPEGWPPTFKDFVATNFPDFKIPASVRSGLVLAGAGDMAQLRAAQQKIDGGGR